MNKIYVYVNYVINHIDIKLYLFSIWSYGVLNILYLVSYWLKRKYMSVYVIYNMSYSKE